jgi:hypothetical protein
MAKTSTTTTTKTVTFKAPVVRYGAARKFRTQACHVFTDDARLRKMALGVVREHCLVDDVSESGFLIDPNNQYTDIETGEEIQLLGERSTIPICPYKQSSVTDLKAAINQIYHEAQEAEKLRQYKSNKQNKLRDWVLKIIVVCTVPLLLIFTIVYFFGGKK